MATQPAKPLTLTQASTAARQLILVGGITLGLLMVGRFFLSSFSNFWIATHPTPPPPPTRGFGILPNIPFPQSSAPPLSYQLQIPPSGIPSIPDRMKVFFIPTKRANLLTAQKAGTVAKALGFLFDPSQLTNVMYRWSRTQPLPSTLDMDIETGTFTMTLNWQSDPSFLQNNRLPNEDDAISQTRSYLESAQILPPDIATGSAKVSYLKASGGTYESAVSLSEADFLQIDMFRTKIDATYDVVTDKPGHGTIRAIVTGKTDRNNQFASIEYAYFPVTYSAFETYPLLTPTQAFQLLNTGKGFIASPPQGTNVATIRSLSLSYYDSPTPQEYLQPIYVFEGDNNFVAYVPAIKQ